MGHCQHCGLEFQKHHGLQKYCSSTCARTHHESKRRLRQCVCAACGKTFLSKRSRSKYCSMDCYAEAVNWGSQSRDRKYLTADVLKHAADARRARILAQGIRVTRTCRKCGKKYSTRRATNLLFCSFACYSASKKGLGFGARIPYKKW